MKTEKEYLEAILQPFSELDAKKSSQIHSYLKLVLAANQKTNLTAITDWNEAVVKHFYDSLAITRWPYWREATKIVDLGAGAGFPGLPLAILYPHRSFYLIEASKKKAAFLTFVKDRLSLNNTVVLNERAETIAHQSTYREQFEVVTARAVATVAVLLELAIPLCQPYGYFIAYKGRNYQEEMDRAQNAMQILGAALTDEIHYELPNALGERTLLAFQKRQNSPSKYPRRPGIPAKRPL